MSVWIRRQPVPGSRIRLFCLPHAGGGASLFARWPRLAASSLEICPFQLPGHEDRIHEPTIVALPTLLSAAAAAMCDLLDRPYALFGHSLGAQLAFHLTHALRTRHMPAPIHLFVSASGAPGTRSMPVLTGLSDREFIAHVVRRFGGISPAVLAEPELLQAVLPGMRADFRLVDQTAGAPSPPVGVPITAFGGRSDPSVSQADLDGWRHYTSEAFRLEMFDGDHFYLRASEASLLERIRSNLQPLIAPPSDG